MRAPGERVYPLGTVGSNPTLSAGKYNHLVNSQVVIYFLISVRHVENVTYTIGLKNEIVTSANWPRCNDNKM
jgi:hypothetical protein